MKPSLALCLFALLSCATPPEPTMPAEESADVIQRFTGTIVEVMGEPGSKSEGERWLVFVVGDERFELDNPGTLQAGDQVTVRARRVTPSPYAAHRPGPRLEVVEVVEVVEVAPR